MSARSKSEIRTQFPVVGSSSNSLLSKAFSIAFSILTIVPALLGSTAQAQTADPSQPGQSVMPPGQYVLTHMGTGQSTYVTVTPSGQMYTQSAPAILPSIMQNQQLPVVPGQNVNMQTIPGQYVAPQQAVQYGSVSEQVYAQQGQQVPGQPTTNVAVPNQYAQGYMQSPQYAQYMAQQQAMLQQQQLAAQQQAELQAQQAQQQAQIAQQQQAKAEEDAQEQAQQQQASQAKRAKVASYLSTAVNAYYNYKYGGLTGLVSGGLTGSSYAGYGYGYSNYYPTMVGYPSTGYSSGSGGILSSILSNL